MRTTARLYCEGLTESEIIDRIEHENLFQYPTEKMLRVITAVGTENETKHYDKASALYRT